MLSPKPDDTTLLDLFLSGRRLTYRPKELIYRLGDEPSGVYLIHSGMVKIYTLNSRADESIIMTLRAGETFLMDWALSGQVGPIYIMTMTRTEVLRIMRSVLIEACQTQSAIALRVMKELAGQLTLLTDHINNLDYRSAHERVIYQLLHLANRHGKAVGAGAFIINRLNASHSHIAGSTSLARETVTREINNLEAQGMIRRVQKDIIIPDINKLACKVELEWPILGTERVGSLA